MLCGLVTFLFHLCLLALFAMLPWGDFSDDNVGDGTLVMIGKLPTSLDLDELNDEFETDEELTPNDQSFDDLDSEIFSPTIVGDLAKQSPQDLAFSSSQKKKHDLLFQSESESTLLANGANDFASLVSRLKKDGLDIVITFDSTGSMQGEINQVKNQIHRIGSVLFELIEKTRIGICTYRDFGDEYVVDGLPLTDNLAEIVLYLENVSASGGGDEPEAVEEGPEVGYQPVFSPPRA